MVVSNVCCIMLCYIMVSFFYVITSHHLKRVHGKASAEGSSPAAEGEAKAEPKEEPKAEGSAEPKPEAA